jgi:hypothetical protein
MGIQAIQIHGRLAAVVLGLALAQGALADDAPEVDPPGRVARLSELRGEVSMQAQGLEEWSEALLNRPLTDGDRLWVENGGRAELQIDDASVHLDEHTGFGIVALDDHVMHVELSAGSANLRVRRLADDETIEVDTPNTSISLLHVGEYTISVNEAGDATVVAVRSGEADVRGDNKDVFSVHSGEQSQFTGTHELQAGLQSVEPRTDFERWSSERDAAVDHAQSARYVSNDVIGYEDLDRYGSWDNDDEYGSVWYPTAVAVDWAPYRFGRWAWISPWGWTWVDAAPWGFAPFHYGRWAYRRERWCWVPGPRHLRPVYAPALVAWVGGPQVGVTVGVGQPVGWFPLGPREPFVPRYRYHVSDHYVTRLNGFGYRAPPAHYLNRGAPRAVTVVNVNVFTSAQPVGHHLVRTNQRDWRPVAQAPAFTPTADSRRGGGVARPPQFSPTLRDRGVFAHRESSSPIANGLRAAREKADDKAAANTPRPVQSGGEPRWRGRDADNNNGNEPRRVDGRSPERRADRPPRNGGDRGRDERRDGQDNDRRNDNRNDAGDRKDNHQWRTEQRSAAPAVQPAQPDAPSSAPRAATSSDRPSLVREYQERRQSSRQSDDGSQANVIRRAVPPATSVPAVQSSPAVREERIRRPPPPEQRSAESAPNPPRAVRQAPPAQAQERQDNGERRRRRDDREER